jgi:competence protein ComEA
MPKPQPSLMMSYKDPGGRPAASKKATTLTDPININEATLVELQRLPSVGPRRAQLIVEERKKRPFGSIEELRRVPGIGPKTLEKLLPYITVEREATVRVPTSGGP